MHLSPKMTAVSRSLFLLKIFWKEYISLVMIKRQILYIIEKIFGFNLNGYSFSFCFNVSDVTMDNALFKVFKRVFATKAWSDSG